MKQSICILIAFIVLASCSKTETPKQQTSVKSQLKSASLVSASNSFNFELLKKADEKMPDNNAFVSPFSIIQALSMTYNGAKGQTKTEIANVLGFKDYSEKEVNDYNQSLANAILKADEKVIFEIANSIWYKTGFDVLQSFIDINKTYYNAEVKEAPFNEQTLNDINNWCKAKTHEKIPTVLDYIPNDARMYLINAIYFNGTWKYAFDKTKTIKTKFNKENGENIDHDQMALETELNYFAGSDFSILELPYGNEGFNLTLLLPAVGKSMNSIVATLNSEIWKTAVSKMTKKKVVVKIPKFKLEAKYEFGPTLAEMGMPTAFSYESDFSGIDGKNDLYISRVIHKTFVDLKEEGTEAAAVTVVEMLEKTSNAPDPKEQITYFIVDKPFLYAITEKSTGVILFMGKMMDPAQVKVEMQ